MINNLPSLNNVRFAPNMLTVRLSEQALPSAEMGLDIPHIASFSHDIEGAPDELNVLPLQPALKKISEGMDNKFGVQLTSIHFTRTFENIDSDFISETGSSPTVLATTTELQGIPPTGEDPLGLTRTFTLYLDFKKTSGQEVQQQEAEEFLLYVSGYLENSDPVKIDRVDPVPLYFAAYTPNGPEYLKQWHHQTIDSENAWEVQRGDSSVVVAVVDTGVDLDHRDLKQNLIFPGVNTTSRTPTSLNLPKGWTVADNYAGINPSTNQINEPKDEHGHGTHVAGIIAAEDNHQGGVGVAHNCKILPIKSLVRARDPQGKIYAVGNALEIANGVLAAARDDRVRIINLSLGGNDAAPDLFLSLQAARGFGKLVTIAMGNEAGYRLSYPAAFKVNRPSLMDHVLCVGATTKGDFLAPFSNLGSCVDLVAPGDKLWSTLPNDNYGSMSGTSMAAPVVAGVAALLFSRSQHLTPQLVAAMLKGASIPLGGQSPNIYFGFGRISSSGVLP